jgi:hypothetical protein
MTWFLLPYLALRGFCEGMVMTRRGDPMCAANTVEEGVRCHVWFKKWYHVLTLLRDGLPMLYIYRTFSHDIAGVLFLGWELSELMYNFARYRKGIIPHENVFGYKSVDGAWVYVIHVVRIILGVFFILIST